jgi:nucleoside diphosphate kinase
MATATRIAKQTAKTYQSVLLVRKVAQDKLNALLASQAAYTLFEHNETHPYYAQVVNAKNFVDRFEELSGVVLGVDAGNGTIAFELDKIQATLIVNDKDKDESIESLRVLPKASQRKIQALKLGEQVTTVYESATWLWSFCDLKATKAQLEKLHNKKLIKRHLEVPYININAECRNAVKDVKKLAAMLLNLTIKGKCVRLELEAKRSKNPSQSLSVLLALKDKGK